MSDLREALSEAMTDAWNSICADTGCHPLDIERVDGQLFFKPAHWVEQIAMLLSTRAALAQPEAVEPVAWRVKNDFGHWYATMDRALAMTWRNTERLEVQPLFTTPPLAPDERMRRALEKIAGSHWERVGYCQSDVDDVPDLTAEEAMREAREALSRADEGKESYPVLGAESASGAHVADRTAGANPATGTNHASGCAVHNEPAIPNGPCDCGHASDGKFSHCVSCDMPRTCLDHGRCVGGKESEGGDGSVWSALKSYPRKLPSDDLDAPLERTPADLATAFNTIPPEKYMRPTRPDREAIARVLAYEQWPLATHDERQRWTEKHWQDWLRHADLILALQPRAGG